MNRAIPNARRINFLLCVSACRLRRELRYGKIFLYLVLLSFNQSKNQKIMQRRNIDSVFKERETAGREELSVVSLESEVSGGIKSHVSGLKFKKRIFKLCSHNFRSRMATVFCCVCIIVFGMTLFTKAEPVVTTSIGENISTNNLSVSGNTDIKGTLDINGNSTFIGVPTFSNTTYSALFPSGNVGIGTTIPQWKLSLCGPNALVGNTQCGYIESHDYNVDGISSGQNNIVFGADTNSNIRLFVNNVAKHIGFKLGHPDEQAHSNIEFRDDGAYQPANTTLIKLNGRNFMNDTNPTDYGKILMDNTNLHLSVGTGNGKIKMDSPVEISIPAYPPLRVIRTSNNTNAISGVFDIQQSTSNDMIDGFGPIMAFNIADGSQEVNPIAYIGAIRSGADNSGSFIIDTYNAGMASTKLTILPSGNVGIGTTTPDVSALLDISSTTQGILPPRMTTEQRDAISSPVEGLMIYNLTAHKINVYNGTTWEQVTSGL